MYYYFASSDNFDNKILNPRIPKNKMNNEDEKTERICVSQSINGCLTAIGGFNLGDIVYIHRCDSNKVIQPTIKQVEDVCFTGEQWVLEPVKMELFMKVILVGMIDSTIGDMSNIMYSYKLLSDSKIATKNLRHTINYLGEEYEEWLEAIKCTDIKLKNDKGEFKSTYDLLQEMSEKYGSDKELK